MPYGIRTQNDKHCVYNKDTGETVPSGCYDDPDKAKARLAAMNINTHDGAKSYDELDDETKLQFDEWRETAD